MAAIIQVQKQILRLVELLNRTFYLDLATYFVQNVNIWLPDDKNIQLLLTEEIYMSGSYGLLLDNALVDKMVTSLVIKNSSPLIMSFGISTMFPTVL